jgi:Zn-dependent alcohol dehydrogenase
MFAKTRAVIDVEFGKPLVIDEVELPDPGPHHVIVKQFATGVCHSQLHRLRRENDERPALMGHESTGVVVARGQGVDYVTEGDHVLLSWVPRNAYPGMPGHYTPMATFRGKDLPIPAGSFSWMETVVCDDRWVVKMDRDLPTDVTAIVGCAVMTGAGAVLNTAHVTPGSSVAVYGIGGLGICTVQACANMSAFPIIAIDVSDEKLEYARQFGATHVINAAQEDPVAKVKEITNGGADYAFDMIGMAQTIAQLMPSVRRGAAGFGDGGTGVLVGVQPANPPIPVRDLIGGSRKLMNTQGGSGHAERDFPLYLKWFRQAKMPLEKIVTRRYHLEQINEACQALEQGQILGRAIVQF